MDSLAFMYYNLEPQSVPTDYSESESTEHTTGEETSDDHENGDSETKISIEELRNDAEAALETAVSLKEDSDYEGAIQQYNNSLEYYQAAKDMVELEDTETKQELTNAIEATRQGLDQAKRHDEDRKAIIELLKPAERSLQEAIVAFIDNDHTVARIRFRQARDTFEEAHETITQSEGDLLSDAIEVTVQPDRGLPSSMLSELARISEGAATALADSGVETVNDLDSGDESPWTPANIEELVADDTIDEDVATTLTLLSWWHGDESYTFETAETVEKRQQQADYGFNQSS